MIEKTMRFIQTFQLYDFLDTLVSLMTAFVLGTLIGAERQYRQRSAGLRTNVLVAVGASAFVDLANRLTGADGNDTRRFFVNQVAKSTWDWAVGNG
jgi:putative Mg2+ transporter-C (MgtC) family protein